VIRAHPSWGHDEPNLEGSRSCPEAEEATRSGSRGQLSDFLLAAFEGLSATVEPVQTVLHGPVRDQAALRGLLDRIQSLGLDLVEVRRLPETPSEPDHTPPG
jgi:hypothetical protein